MSALVLRVGALAYFDGLHGLVPCKVLRIDGPSGRASSAQLVTFRVTAARGHWPRGEISTTCGLHVLPRAARYKRRGSPFYRIRFYTVEAPEPGQAQSAGQMNHAFSD